MKQTKAEAADAFFGILHAAQTYDKLPRWQILVTYSDFAAGFVCELFRITDRPVRRYEPMMLSPKFKSPWKALRWAHQFDVPVHIDPEELNQPEGN